MASLDLEGPSLLWPSVCDLVSCDVPPVPNCEDGLQPVLANPGECRPSFTCGESSLRG